MVAMEAMMAGGVRWTREQEQFLNDHYEDPDGPEKLVILTGKTYTQVLYKAHKMGKHRKRRPRTHLREFYADPPEPRWELLQTKICPGNGSGFCGKMLLDMPGWSPYGYTAQNGEFDLVCVNGHRFLFPGRIAKRAGRGAGDAGRGKDDRRADAGTRGGGDDAKGKKPVAFRSEDEMILEYVQSVAYEIRRCLGLMRELSGEDARIIDRYTGTITAYMNGRIHEAIGRLERDAETRR